MTNWKNKLYCGDNLEVLSSLEKESVDLVYIDPPFFSDRNYEIIWGDEAEIRSFEDRWEGGINVYIDWMKQRVIELYRVLKPTGSFYLHCDWHASHYLKVMCDEVFGYNNFRNEVVWCYNRWTATSKDFQRMHDIILRYNKTKEWTFNVLREIDDSRIITLGGGYTTNLLPNGERQLIIYRGSENKENIQRLIKSKKFVRVIYKDPEGNPLRDYWKLDIINPNAKERLGYPTQKPESLLERIIKTSSNKDDIMLDAFCGCGTALAVAEKLKRKWIGIDISPSAISLIKKRLSDIPGFAASAINYDVIGMPQTAEDLKCFKPFEFQYWVINEMHGMPSSKKSGDKGIDGLSFFEHCPIQVKQSKSVGVGAIYSFETALRIYYHNSKRLQKGYVVAFSFGKGAKEEVARANRQDEFDIHLVTVEDILNKTFSLTQYQMLHGK